MRPINSRIIIATFRTSDKKITSHIIQGFAPTNEASDDDKDDFYRLLIEIVDKEKEKDLVIIMGDFNVKIVENNRGYERVIFKHGLGEMSNILTREDDQLKRWTQHFNELLNRPPPSEAPSISEARAQLNVSCERPSKLGIVCPIKMLKTGKAAGPDNIPPEALKADRNLSADILCAYLERSWKK